MHEFLSHFWIRCPYYTLTTPYNCLILMFSSKICYLFTVCTRSHDPLSGENLSPHAVDGIGLDIAEELARAGRDEVLTCEVIGLNAHVYPLTRLGIEVGAAGSDLRRRHTVGQVAAVALVPALQPAIVAHVAKLEQLFAQGSVPAITNLIRKDLSTLAEEKMLSPALMQQIHQDFQQVLYSVLSANEIQAHELFRDDACVRLNQTAESSIMNMIKWVSVAADRAVRTIRETHQVNSIAGKIRQYCQEHFAEKISNREIADAVYLTPDYANRVFKDAYGLSIKDYLTDLRMQKAQLLLRDEANTISEVTAQVGFDNFSYFSTQFKKYTGLTPNEWKRQNG